MDKISTLKSVFVFGGLEDSLLAEIAKQLKETKLAAGSAVFAEGQPADAFFIVASGEVTISKRIGAGKEKVLAAIGPGSVFGEMAFFSDSPRTADASAKNGATLWKIERNDFMSFITEKPAADSDPVGTAAGVDGPAGTYQPGAGHHISDGESDILREAARRDR